MFRWIKIECNNPEIIITENGKCGLGAKKQI